MIGWVLSGALLAAQPAAAAAFHGPLLGRLQGETQIRNAHRLYDSATAISVPEKNILEAFRPGGILRRLDQSSASVREGMRINLSC